MELDVILKKLEQMDKRMIEVEREVRQIRNNDHSTQNDSNFQSRQRDYSNSENRGKSFRPFKKGRIHTKVIEKHLMLI